MAFETEGIDQLRLILKRAMMIPAEAETELHALAIETMELARNMAPEEFGDLKDSIKMRSRNALGRFSKAGMGSSYEIYVDSNHRVSSENEAKNGIETVGEYAWYVHEHMGWGTTPGSPNNSKKGSYMPSDISVQIGNKFGVEAGGKFMERAGIEIKRTMSKKLGVLIPKLIQALDL